MKEIAIFQIENLFRKVIMRLYWKKWKIIKGFIKKLLDKAEKIMVQSDEDRKRYVSLGLTDEKVKVYKNLKYSIKYEVCGKNIGFFDTKNRIKIIIKELK